MAHPHPPCPTPFNLAAHALHRAADLADKPALEIVGRDARTYSYAQMEAAVRGCGTYLLQQGLSPGDRILMRLGNSPAFPILFLGAIAAGLIPVPTAAALTAREITAMAAIIAPKLIVADTGVALPECPCPVLPAAAILAADTCAPCTYAVGDPNRLAYIVFTSGTSGKPLPVAHAHRAIWARGMMYQGWEGLGQSDRLLHAGALNWTYTLGTGLLDPWVQGATALIPSADVKPADLPDLLRRHRITIFAAAPGIYRQILKADLPPLPHLRHGLSAGEALAPNLAARWLSATKTAVHQALGLSECSTFISGSPARPAPVGSIGTPQPGRRIAILSDAGAKVPQGHPGILAIHRDDPGLMLGYYNAPEATADRFAGDWFLTGDHVSQAKDGAITYLGRHDDMMNPGGFRVSPSEVETAMALLPHLTDCAAVEVEPTPGSRIIACLYTSDVPITDQTLTDHATATLARYKQPRLYIRLDALPRNANNKLNRAQLRHVAQSHLTAQEPL